MPLSKITSNSVSLTTLAASGAATLSSTLGVTGAATLSSTLGVTGVTTVQAGTAALPALTTTGDTNTGIFFPAADTIAFSEGGVEAMRIDSSGNVTLAGKLDVTKRATFAAPASFGAISASTGTVEAHTLYGNVIAGNGSSYDVMIVNRNGAESLGVISNTQNLITPGTFQSALAISVGNATPTTSGAGITFPATVSLSTDANTLDDYEEGTWTPSLGGNTTYTARTGTYTKIGNTVRVYLEVTVNLIGTGSTTTISGFPFSPFGNDAGCVSYFDTLNASVYWLTIQMQSGGNCIFAGTTAATATIVNGVSIFRNGARIIGTAVYQTSS